MSIRSIVKRIVQWKPHIKEYKPTQLSTPSRNVDVASAWVGLERIIKDLIDRYELGMERCLEFGVEFGYSAVAFSSYFDEVIGVDTFEGDRHTTHKRDHFEETKQRLADYPNIHLVKSDYRDFIKQDHGHFNFAHVDIVHNYNETYECGLWTAQHADVVVFHDTESFAEVRRAVIDIGKTMKCPVLNYPHHHGLGIVVSKQAGV